MADSANDPIRTALENGANEPIPDRIREGFRLHTEDTLETRAFQGYMEAMAREILGDAEVKRLGIRFFVSDEPYANAGKILYAKPPIIMFTRTLLEALKEENLIKKADKLRNESIDVPEEFAKNGKGMLMGILAHEIKHIYLGDRNSKGIETECDKYAVQKLIERHYRNTSLLEALQFLVSSEVPSTQPQYADIREYLDVHPKTDVRLRFQDDEFFRQFEGEGNFKIKDWKRVDPEPHALPPAFFDSLGAERQTYVGQLLEARGYEQKTSTAEKLVVLHDIIKNEMPGWNKNNHQPRLEEVVKLLKALEVKKSAFAANSREKDQVDKIADTILGIGITDPKESWYGANIYRALSSAWHEQNKGDRPLGTYEMYARKLEKFIHAPNAAEARTAALEIERLGFTEKAPGADVWMDIPQFKRPTQAELYAAEERIFAATQSVPQLTPVTDEAAERYGIKPSWHEHVSWALAETQGDNPIARVLYRMQIKPELDPRLAPVYADDAFPKNKPNILIDSIVDTIKAKPIVTPAGYIVGMDTSQQSPYDRDRELDYTARSVRFEHLKKQGISLSNVDWTPIASGEDAAVTQFLEKYHVHLLPDVRTRNKATDFQRRFTEEAEKRLLRHKAGAEQGNDFWPAYHIKYFFSGSVPKHVGANDSLREEIFIAPDHPYVQFVAKNPGGIFDVLEQARVLEATISSNVKPDEKKFREAVGGRVNEFRSALGYKEPTNSTELFAVLDHLNGDGNNYSSSLLKVLADHEVITFLNRHPDAQLSATQLASVYALAHNTSGGLIKPHYEKELKQYVERHHEHELQLPAAELIDAYNLHQQSLFFRQRVELRESYENAIRKKVSRIDNTQEQQGLLEKLLLSDEKAATHRMYFNYNFGSEDESPKKFLADPVFRKWAIDRWVGCAAETTAMAALATRMVDIGPKNPKYLPVAEKVAEQVLARADGVTRYTMLTEWLDRVEAQKGLSDYVRDRLNEVAEGELARLQYQASAGEAFLDHLAFDPVIRQRTIEYLRDPPSPDGASTYAKELRDSAKKLLQETSIRGIPGFVKKAIEEALKKTDLYDADLKVATYAAQILHKNFARAPMGYRMFLMEKVFIPPNSATVKMDKEPQAFAFDAALPETEQFAKYGRSLLGHYLGSLQKNEEYVKRMYLSALLVAEDPSFREADPYKRLGKAIHTLLGNMDNPLAAKISQAIDSAPNIHDGLRNPESKTRNKIPPRWVVHEMFEKHASKDIKETTTRLGWVRGGAVGIAVELEKDTAKMAEHGYTPEHIKPKTVFKMVRNGAQNKVVLHAPRVSHMITKAIEEFDELRPGRAIIDHAIRAAKVETDFENAPAQAEIARRTANGIEITIDGEKFIFHEVPMLKANSTSHELGYANGTVFNELPEGKKSKAAHAIFTLENYLQLLGQHVDWDRHGGQPVVDGNHIYLLDRGGMALDLPQPEEKRLLGRTLAAALNDFVAEPEHMPLDKALGKAVDATADKDGSVNHYLATIARGQHNLGDVRREITTDQQMRSMIAVFMAKQVDPDVMQSAQENMSEKTRGWLMQQAAGQAAAVMFGGSVIKIHDPNIELRKQPFDAEAYKKEAMSKAKDDPETDRPEIRGHKPRRVDEGDDRHGPSFTRRHTQVNADWAVRHAKKSPRSTDRTRTGADLLR